jgi:hypothetical protein
MPKDSDDEKWVRLYKMAIHAIDNAHRMLSLLEGEEERYAAEEKGRCGFR